MLQKRKPPRRGSRFIEIAAEMDFGCVLCELVLRSLHGHRFLQSNGFENLKLELGYFFFYQTEVISVYISQGSYTNTMNASELICPQRDSSTSCLSFPVFTS